MKLPVTARLFVPGEALVNAARGYVISGPDLGP